MIAFSGLISKNLWQRATQFWISRETILVLPSSCKDRISNLNAKFVLHYGQIIIQPIQEKPHFQASLPFSISQRGIDGLTAHKYFNLFRDKTTIRVGVVLIEIENYSQFVLGADRRPDQDIFRIKNCLWLNNETKSIRLILSTNKSSIPNVAQELPYLNCAQHSGHWFAEIEVERIRRAQPNDFWND